MESAPTLKQQTLSYIDELRQVYIEKESMLDNDPVKAIRHLMIGPLTGIYAAAHNASLKPQYMSRVHEYLQSEIPVLRSNWDKMPQELKDKLGINKIDEEIVKLEQLKNFDDYPNKLLWTLDIIEAVDKITHIIDTGLMNFNLDSLDI